MEGGHWNLEDPSERNWPVQERDFDDFLGDSLISSSAHRDGEGSLWSSSELDSDVEDAIYAQIYFDKNEQEPDRRVMGETSVGSAHQSFSVSLHMTDQDEAVSATAKKKKKTKRSRRKKGRANPDTLAPVHEASKNSGPQDLWVEDHSNKNPFVVSSGHSELRVELEKKMVKGDRAERRKCSTYGVTSVPSTSGDSVVLCLDGDESRCEAVTERRKNGGANDSSRSDSDCEVYIVGVEGGHDERIVISSGPDERIVISSESEGAEPGDGHSDGTCSDDASSGGELSESSPSGEDVPLSDMELCSEGEVVEDADDPWHIIKKDVMGRDAYERRFEGREGAGRYYAGRFKKCSNCKQKGHMEKECPHPKRHRTCYFCAGLDHMISNCPHDMCPYCYRPKHRGRSCGLPWASAKTQCSRCFMTGHHASICPDQWRQFHNTTYADRELMRIHPAEQRQCEHVFCYNCGRKGHFGFECTKARMKFSPQPHFPLIAKYDAVWPPRMDHRRFSSAVERRGITVTAKRGLLKRSVSYDPQLPSSKKGRYQVHPNSSVKGTTNEYGSEADFRSFPPPSGSSRFPQPGGVSYLRNDRRLSAPLSRSSLDSSDQPLLDSPNQPLLAHPPGFHDRFRPTFLPHPEPHRNLPPYNPTPISRHELVPPRKSFSEPRPPSTRHEEHHPREHLPPYPHHRRKWDDLVEEDYPRTPFRQPKMNQPPLSRTFEDPPPPPKYRRSSDISDRRFPGAGERRFSDFSDRLSNRTSGADLVRTKLPDQRRHSTYPDGVLRSERGFRGSQHITRVDKTDLTKRRNSNRY